VCCGKTVEWIRMLFGMVSGVGRGMGALDRGSDRRKERGSFGVNLGRPIVTSGHLAMRLFANYFGQDLLHYYMVIYYLFYITCMYVGTQLFLLCFDAVGWAAARASGL